MTSMNDEDTDGTGVSAGQTLGSTPHVPLKLKGGHSSARAASFKA